MFKLVKLFTIIGIFLIASVEGAGLQENEGGLSDVNQGIRAIEKETATATDRGIDDGSPSTVELVGRIVVYLLLLVAIGVVVLHFFRQGRFIKRVCGKGNALKVLETRMLGNKQFLVVVEYGEHKVLLGVGPGMIKKLCFLNDGKGKLLADKRD